MKLKDALKKKKFVVTSEVQAPIDQEPEDLVRNLSQVRGRVDGVSLSEVEFEGIVGDTIKTCELLNESLLEPIYQTTTRDKNRLQLAWISAAEGEKFAQQIKEMEKIAGSVSKAEITKTVKWLKDRRAKKAQKAKKKKASPVEEWEMAMEQAKDATVKAYALDGSFGEGEKVDHSTFGQGLVLKLISPNKMEVIFEEGSKFMIRGNS